MYPQLEAQTQSQDVVYDSNGSVMEGVRMVILRRMLKRLMDGEMLHPKALSLIRYSRLRDPEPKLRQIGMRIP